MFVSATGMACPVGLSAESACAAYRAGIQSTAELPYLDNAGEPTVGAVVPGIDWALRRGPRLLELLTLAFDDLHSNRSGAMSGDVPLLLCLAEAPDAERKRENADLAAALQKALHEQYGARFHPRFSGVVAIGQTSAFRGLSQARRLMADENLPACIVCAVDSLLNAATLLALDRHYRLKTPANRDGLIPGEASVAVRVQARPTADCCTEIVGLGFGTESAPILSGEPLLGHGLATAARGALAQARLGFHEIDLRLSDASGELYGFKEIPLVEGRLMRVPRKQAQPLWHWAESIGDSGAAAGMAQAVLVDESFRKRYAPGPVAMGLTASASGDRAAAVFRRVGP